MADDRFADWDEADGEAEAYGPLDDDEEPVSRRAGGAALLVGGLLLAALAVGAAVSWPGLSTRWARREVPPAAPAAQTPGLTVQLAQGGAGQPLPPASAPPLEPANAVPIAPPPTTRPDRPAPPPGAVVRALGPVAPAQVPPTSAQPPPLLARAEPPPPEAPPVEPPRVEPDGPPAVRLAAPVRVPGALDCAAVVSLAQDIACRDPGLRAADRRMAEAYVGALAAGASERRLRRDQVDWLNLREDAARHSKQAVENLYRRRIQELEGVADAPPP